MRIPLLVDDSREGVDGRALQYASRKLRADKDTVLMAQLSLGGRMPNLPFKGNDAIRYAAESLKRDHDIVRIVLARQGGMLEVVPEAFRSDKESGGAENAELRHDLLV